MLAKDVMATDIIAAKEDASVEEITSLMIKNRISGLPIVDNNDCLVGIVTEHDLLYKKKLPMSIRWIYNYGRYTAEELAVERHKAQAKTASELMTTEVVTVDETTPLSRIIHLVIEKEIKRIPVIRGRKLVGIISRADVLQVLLAKSGKAVQKCWLKT